MCKTSVLLLWLVAVAWTVTDAGTSRKRPSDVNGPSCGYQSCAALKDDMINVHLVCHTHDDVGWLKTVDQYYYGYLDLIQQAGVQYSIDSVVTSLLQDVNRKFIYVETAFFWRWWTNQDEQRQEEVRLLVNNGQLEFIGGGWCMNDEATAHYVDTIDQMSWGLKYLKDEFGECGIPRTGWQIDPFGHAREQASLFGQFGFDGQFFSRLDFQDRAKRLSEKNMEQMWYGTSNLGIKGSVFTGMMPVGYGPPLGFCFDILCSDGTAPIMDDPKMTDYNVDKRIDQFIKVVNNQAVQYATNNIMFTMGEDFFYMDANRWYKNLDKIIKYTNERQKTGSKINVIYSTPSCYLQALHKANRTWSVKTDDFFPYASDEHAYWTGYFTSRPTLKGYVRSSNNVLQACKQLDALAKLTDQDPGDVITLRQAQGVLQHHDAVAGTEKQHVTNDYSMRLAKGVAACQDRMDAALKNVLPLGSEPVPTQVYCTLTNVSKCDFTQTSDSFVLTVYNPVGRPVSTPVRIPVPVGASYSVKGPDGTDVVSQIVPVPDSVLSQPERQGSDKSNDLVFIAETVPALGVSTFFITKGSSSKTSQMSQSVPILGDDQSIANDYIEAVVDGTSGLLKSVTDKLTGLSLEVAQNFYWYYGHPGDNLGPANRASGAYIFRPTKDDADVITTQAVNVTVITGPIVSEIQQTFTDSISQIIRIYNNQQHVEIEWLVGPVPVDDGTGKEVVSRFHTSLATDGKVYTDSMGREILERIRNHRDTWDVDLAEPTAGNYYPVNSRIYIKDSSSQLTVLTDRSLGGASLADGDLELMVHRRLLYDDAKGVGEALNEPGFDGKGLVVRGKHYLQISDVASAAVKHRTLAQNLLYGPIVSFANNTLSPADYQTLYKTQFSGLSQVLPDNVHLLTFERWTDTEYLLRLEHFFDASDDPNDLSKPVSVDLKTLLGPMTVVSATETVLGANQLYSDNNRLVWNTDTPIPDGPSNDFDDSLVVQLSPMQIRTFLVKVA